MRLHMAPLVLSVIPALGAQTPASPAGGASPSPVPMTSFRSDVLHLSYSFPARYTDASAVVGPAFQASFSGDPASAAQATCLSFPLSRMDANNGQMGLLILIRADAGCLKKKFTAKSVVDAAQDEARGLAASGAKTNFGKPLTFDLAARPAALLQGSFTLPTGQTMQAMVVCVLDQPDIACWQFLASATDRLKLMSAFPVAFDGAPATPLVPSGVLTKP